MDAAGAAAFTDNFLVTLLFEPDLLKDRFLLKLSRLESVSLVLPCVEAAFLRLACWERVFVGFLEGDLDEALARGPSSGGEAPPSCSTSLEGALDKRLDTCLEVPVVDVIVLTLDTPLTMDDVVTLVTLDLLVALPLKLLSSSEVSCLVDCRRRVPKLLSLLAVLLDAPRGLAPSAAAASFWMLLLLLLLACLFKDRDLEMRFT